MSKRLLQYTSFENWSIGQILIGLGRTAEHDRGSWVTDASESEIRNAAAICGVSQLVIQESRPVKP